VLHGDAVEDAGQGVNEQNVNELTYVKVLCVNAQSIVNKKDELTLRIHEEKPDIVGITESWTHDQITNAELDIAGFNLYRKDRIGKRGGGVLLYVKNCILVEEINVNDAKDFEEYLYCMLTIGNSRTALILCYRAPSNGTAQDRGLFEIFKKASKGDSIIIGDFNYPNVDWKNHLAKGSGRRFLKVVDDCFLQQLTKDKTCGENVLDLVFVTDNKLIDEVTVVQGIGKSVHEMVLFNLIIRKKRTIGIEKVNDFNYARGEYKLMADMCNQVEWEYLMEENDGAIIGYDNFLSIMDILKEMYIKRKPVKKAWKKEAWVTREVVVASRKKKRVWLKFRQNRSEENKLAYDNSKKDVICKVKNAVIDFEKKLAAECKINSKGFFRYIKSKTKGTDAITALKAESGDWVKGNVEITNMLNKYFQSVFITDDKKAITIEKKVETRFDLSRDDITEDEVNELLGELKVDKGAGPDGMHPKLLKELRAQLAKPLVEIFRSSIDSSEVPQEWRDANVTPIFKGGSKTEAKNYRPISITSVVGRLLEKIIKKKLANYLEENDILNDCQFGFRKGRSCTGNLLKFMNFVLEAVDQGHSVDVVYLDLAKAFDKVSHEKLLIKLESLGIEGNILKWIGNWLRNRRQRVVINGMASEWVSVTSGVPQGSVLGPLLFLTYVADIGDSVLGNLAMFADDSKIARVVDTEHDLVSMQSDLDNVQAWMVKWQMEINVNKCGVMHFGTRNTECKYNLNATQLKVVEEEKDLGICIDRKLNFSKQCAAAANRANRILGMIKRNVRSRDRDVIMRLYKGIVRPLLEYGIQAWRPYKMGDIAMMERVQRRATKMIYGLWRVTYEDRLKLLGLTTLEKRRQRGDMIMTYRILNGLEKGNYRDLFQEAASTSTRGNCRRLMKTRSRLNITKFSFGRRVVNGWNSLSDDVVLASNVNKFKNRYDEELQQMGVRST
jgi:ribonuclease P/MRP protein subunit RPP40